MKYSHFTINDENSQNLDKTKKSFHPNFHKIVFIKMTITEIHINLKIISFVKIFLQMH